MYSIIGLLFLIGLISRGNNQQQEQTKKFLGYGTIYQCEGKESSNYTFVGTYTLTSDCIKLINDRSDSIYLIACSPTGQLSTIALQTLAYSVYPAGAYGQFEVLYLALSGPLKGKYIYAKEIYQVESYLKKCSSVLGQSYIVNKSIIILITDKLNVNMFIYPGGAFEPMKKASSTICYANSFVV